MEIACSPTSCLILTLVLWGLTAFMAMKGEPYSLATDEQRAELRRSRAPRRARRARVRARLRSKPSPAAQSGHAL